jgi:ATP-dependent DNA helicase RecG
MTISLSTEVTYLKGVGPQRAAKLAERGIASVEDLLLYLPFRYEDRLHFTAIADIAPGSVVTVQAEVISGDVVRFRRGGNEVFHLSVRDGSGKLHCRFFHGGYLQGRFRPQQRLVLHGKADFDPNRPGRMEMVNPEFEMLGDRTDPSADSTEVGRIVPVYEAIGDISSRMLRRITYQALANLEPRVYDPLPHAIRERYHFPSRREALAAVHFPDPTERADALTAFRSPAQQRLIFEEFFYYQLGIALRRREMAHEPGTAFSVREDRIREALKRILPFKPTEAQKRVLAEIARDLERAAPMNRLLVGDVGSGKTIVALEAAVIVIENGYQTALMAPTEILAGQHALFARNVLARAGYRVDLLVSDLKPAEKKAVRERIRTGEAQFVVGTHALLEGDVEFARLGLVIVDEQHRFGVLQRKRLIEKGARPDVLVMTATPIPRTLSLTLYGELDQSAIDEMPPGRQKIETRISSEDNLTRVWKFVREQVALGRQAYIVYPVIEESKLELKAAIAEYERLSKEVFPDLRVGLLHGRLPGEEKEAVIEKFRRGEIDVLVSTTVIEVGVDVANATVMVIEHAARFGLSQLHQLRGRVGRGAERSYCFLVAPRKMGDPARERLETLVSTTNGAEIAEVDLRLRGPGDFFGTRQHGELGFHVANPLRDFQLLELARREAFSLVERGVESEELERLVKYLGPKWQRRYQLAAVG